MGAHEKSAPKRYKTTIDVILRKDGFQTIGSDISKKYLLETAMNDGGAATKHMNNMSNRRNPQKNKL